MDIRDPEYRGMAKLALDRKDEILVLQQRIKELEARLQAAENFIHLSPCDSDMTTEQWNAYHRWLALGGKQ